MKPHHLLKLLSFGNLILVEKGTLKLAKDMRINEAKSCWILRARSRSSQLLTEKNKFLAGDKKSFLFTLIIYL